MQIRNPSNKAITDVRIFGVSYSIDAEGTLENVPEIHARYWQENLHKFLILRKDKLEEVKKEEVVEVPTPTVTEVIEATPTVESEPSSVVVEETPIVEEVKEEETAVVPAKSKGRPKKRN